MRDCNWPETSTEMPLIEACDCFGVSSDTKEGNLLVWLRLVSS